MKKHSPCFFRSLLPVFSHKILSFAFFFFIFAIFSVLSFAKQAEASVVQSGGITESEAQRGGQQRKVVYANGNWYAFYADALTVFYKKSADGVTWGSAVTLDATSAPFAPTAWVEGTTIYVGWLRDTTDAIAVNTINTAASDTLGTQCTTGDLGAFTASSVSSFVSLAVTDNSSVYAAVGAAASNSFTVQKLTYSSCTFTDITTGSGLTTSSVPTITTIGNNVHMVFQEGALIHSVYDGSTWIIPGGIFTETEAVRGGQQRKVVYASGNWYAFYQDDSSIYYKKSSDGVTWGAAVTLDATNAPVAPSAWVEGTTIYVAWFRDTGDAIAVNTINTAVADTLGIQCTTTDIGDLNSPQFSDFITIAVADDGTTYTAIGADSAATIQKLTYAGCTFTDITTGSGLTTRDKPALTTIGNNVHMVFQDGNISHSIYDGASWTTSNTTIDTDTDSVYSLTTDGTNLWLLTVDGTTAAAFYKCTSCTSSASWSTLISPWPSGLTNLTSVSLTYDSTNSDLYAFAIKDTSAQAYYKLSDATAISWGADTSFGFTTNAILGLGHISSPQDVAGTSQVGITIRNGSDYMFSNLTSTKSIILDFGGINTSNSNFFSLVTDGTNLWLLTVNASSNAAFYKCTSCASSSSWSLLTSPFTGATNLTSASLTYDATNADLYAVVIKDASEQAYYVSSDSTIISWGPATSLGFTAGDLGHISSEAVGAPISVVLRQGANFEFASILLGNQTPTAPTALGPSAFVDGSFTNDNTPTLTFSLSDPDILDTVRYRIQIDDTSDFSSPVTDYTSGLSAQGNASFTVGQIPGTGTYLVGSSGQTLTDSNYYWRVKTIDASAAESSYTTANSGAIAFKVDATAPSVPGVPSTASPTYNTTQDWVWAASTDAFSGVASYAWRVVDTMTMLQVTNGTTSLLTVTTNLAVGIYDFFVKAVDNAGNEGVESQGQVNVTTPTPTPTNTPTPTFTPTPTPTVTPTPTDTPTPTPSSTPTPIPTQTPTSTQPGGDSSGSPSDSSGNQTTCTQSAPLGTISLYTAVPQGNTVTLYFTDASDPYDHYSLEYGTASNSYQFGAQSIGGKGTRTYIVEELSPNTTYYFRVRAANGCAGGVWSSELSSKTKSLLSLVSVADELEIVSTELIPVESTEEQDSCKTYTVRPNDSLWSIATRILGSGIQYVEIIKQNKIKYPSLANSTALSVGWKLSINCQNNLDEKDNLDDEEEEDAGQAYDVNVNVTDENSNALEGATVTLHSTPRTATTDENGKATFKDVAGGEHRVIIEHEGFSGEQSVNLTGDVKTFELNVMVRPSNPFTNPLILGIFGILGVIILFLLVLLKRSRVNKKLGKRGSSD